MPFLSFHRVRRMAVPRGRKFSRDQIEESVATLHLTPTFFPRLTVAPPRQPATGLISISSPRANVAFHLFRTFS